MWSAPVERRSPDGSKYSLVLLDTEGIDAYDQVSAACRERCARGEMPFSLFPHDSLFVRADFAAFRPCWAGCLL
jgi:hypothetical protein